MEELRSRLAHHIDRAVLPMHREPNNDGQTIIIILLLPNNTEPIKVRKIMRSLSLSSLFFFKIRLQVFLSTVSPSLPNSSRIGANPRKAPKMLRSRRLYAYTMHKSGLEWSVVTSFLPNNSMFCVQGQTGVQFSRK